jgi:endonuclease-3 related protein
MTSRNKSSVIQDIYHRLYQEYGPQGWWPGEGPLDVVIGAILTQASAWANVELALQNLKESGRWSLEAIRTCPQEELAAIIHPCGYFNAKARKLKAFADYVEHHYGGDLRSFLSQDAQQLRNELLSIYGIGPETADDILVYAAEKPSFIIDSYTRRILQRVGLTIEKRKNDYQAYQEVFHHNLPMDAALFNEYHALLDYHAKKSCAKVPQCAGCCLRDLCVTGRQR